MQFACCRKSCLMNYNFSLKDNNAKSFRMFIWFLFFLHIIAACVFALNSTEQGVKISVYILLGFYALISGFYYFLRTRKSALETFSLILALLYANFWFQHVGIIAVLIFAAVYILASVIQGKKTTVLIAESGIHLTRVFKTVDFSWGAMDNVILKDNLLTLDFTSNKILQVEISEANKITDESEFNQFCQQQLKK